MHPALFAALIYPWLPTHQAMSIPPEAAARAVAPDVAAELVRICRRETVGPGAGECRALGVHDIDAGWGRRVHQRAAAAGWIDPECQPLGDPAGWSTRGAWGLMGAYHVRRLPPCSPPWLLDYPLVSAAVAADKLRDHCATRPARRLPANDRWAGGCPGP